MQLNNIQPISADQTILEIMAQEQTTDASSEKLSAVYLELLTSVKNAVEQHFESEFQFLDGQAYLTFVENSEEPKSPYFYPEMVLVWYPKWAIRIDRFSVFTPDTGMRLMSVEVDRDSWFTWIYASNENTQAFLLYLEHYLAAFWKNIYKDIDKWLLMSAARYESENAHDCICDCFKHISEHISGIAPFDFEVEEIPLDLSMESNGIINGEHFNKSIYVR
jgi:hypothetical protein